MTGDRPARMSRSRRPRPAALAFAVLLGLLTVCGGVFASAASAAAPATAASGPAAAASGPAAAHQGVSVTAGPVSGPVRLAVEVKKAEGGESGPDGQVRKIAALAGYVAYGIMAMTVTWGILTTTGFARRWVDRPTMQGGHMLLAVLFLTFGWVHGAVYIFQTQEHFSPLKVVVPFASGGEPEVAMGIVGLELALAVAVSIWIQRALSYRRWHLVHWLAYPAFLLSLLHTVVTSKEAQSFSLIGIAVFGALLVTLALFVLRVLPGGPVSKARIAPVEP